MGRDVAIKLVVAPLLIGAASLAGRRFGHAVGGWLVALPLTSGPVAWFLAREHGDAFAATAALGMLAATASQVAFALAYRAVDGPRWATSFAAGASAFLVSTLLLARLELSALATFALVAGIIAVGILVTRRGAPTRADTAPVAAPRFDLAARMGVATAVVVAITALAPAIGPHLAGLVSPFPVFGAVLAVSTHRVYGAPAAGAVLDGLLVGLAAPAVFFLVLALALPPLGLLAFALASGLALAAQGATAVVLPAAADRDAGADR